MIRSSKASEPVNLATEAGLRPRTESAELPPQRENKYASARATGISRQCWFGAKLFSRGTAALEYAAVYLVGKLCGPSYVLRYLRNPNPRITVRLLRAFGATIGEGATIKGSIIVDNVERDANATGDFSHLKIAENCYVGEDVFFDLANEVILESNAVIAGRVAFVTHSECSRSDYLSGKFPRVCKPVIVRSGAFVGFGASLMCGVTIGRNAVIGANSLVLKDADPECVYLGSPARYSRSLQGREPRLSVTNAGVTDEES